MGKFTGKLKGHETCRLIRCGEIYRLIKGDRMYWLIGMKLTGGRSDRADGKRSISPFPFPSPQNKNKMLEERSQEGKRNESKEIRSLENILKR